MKNYLIQFSLNGIMMVRADNIADASIKGKEEIITKRIELYGEEYNKKNPYCQEITAQELPDDYVFIKAEELDYL